MAKNSEEYFPQTTPEKQLLAAMLHAALNDLLFTRAPRAAGQNTDMLYEGRPRQKALEWFNYKGGKESDLFTLVETCEHLNLCPNEVRALANKLHAFAMKSLKASKRKIEIDSINLQTMTKKSGWKKTAILS